MTQVNFAFQGHLLCLLNTAGQVYASDIPALLGCADTWSYSGGGISGSDRGELWA